MRCCRTRPKSLPPPPPPPPPPAPASKPPAVDPKPADGSEEVDAAGAAALLELDEEELGLLTREVADWSAEEIPLPPAPALDCKGPEESPDAPESPPDELELELPALDCTAALGVVMDDSFASRPPPEREPRSWGVMSAT